jgi:hypothetical protein
VTASGDRRRLLAQAAATWTMVGVIWFVQLVHYPLFEKVGADGFAAYETANVSLTPLVVLVPMITEMVLAIWLVVRPPARISRAVALAGALLVLAIWGSTFVFQYPIHQKLSLGFVPATLGALLATNWIRTGAWSVRGVLSLWMLDRGGS